MDAYGELPGKPCVAEFSAEGKQLHYIAAKHTLVKRDTEGNVISKTPNPTLDLIDEQLRYFKPDFIIVEREEKICSGAPSIDIGKVDAEGHEKTIHSESEYAEYRAIKNGISYQGAELSDSVLADGMEKLGYQRSDVLYFYALHFIPHLTEDAKKPISEEELKSHINRYLNRWSGEYGLPEGENHNYDSMKRWFEDHNTNSDLTLGGVKTWSFAPLRGENATFFQKMGADTGDIREAHLNNTIQEALNKHDKVMVVYGAGHLAQSLPVYKAAMGAPKFQAPCPVKAAVKGLLASLPIEALPIEENPGGINYRDDHTERVEDGRSTPSLPQGQGKV